VVDDVFDEGGGHGGGGESELESEALATVTAESRRVVDAGEGPHKRAAADAAHDVDRDPAVGQVLEEGDEAGIDGAPAAHRDADLAVRHPPCPPGDRGTA